MPIDNSLKTYITIEPYICYDLYLKTFNKNVEFEIEMQHVELKTKLYLYNRFYNKQSLIIFNKLYASGSFNDFATKIFIASKETNLELLPENYIIVMKLLQENILVNPLVLKTSKTAFIELNFETIKSKFYSYRGIVSYLSPETLFFKGVNVKIRSDELKSESIVNFKEIRVKKWNTEILDFILSYKVENNLVMLSLSSVRFNVELNLNLILNIYYVK